MNGGSGEIMTTRPAVPTPGFLTSSVLDGAMRQVSNNSSSLLHEMTFLSSTPSSPDWTVSHLLVIVAKGIILSLIIFCVIFGNLLVIAAVVTNRRLRSTLTYFFVISLGIADLLLGIIVLPVSMVTIVHDHRWIFGSTICNLVTCADVTLCTASILNLFLTTCERYIAIASPFRYQQIVTRRNVLISITAVWLLSAFCSFVPLHLGWNTVDGAVQNTRPSDDPNQCLFEWNQAYNTTLSVTTFFIPLVLLAFANARILKIAQRQRETITKQQRAAGENKNNSTIMYRSPSIAVSNMNGYTPGTTRQQPVGRVPSYGRKSLSENRRISFAEERPLTSGSGGDDDCRNNGVPVKSCSFDNGSSVSVNGKEAPINNSNHDPMHRSSSAAQVEGQIGATKSATKDSVAMAIRIFAAENKATITILTIVGFFVACWLPYFVMFAVKPFLDRDMWLAFNASNPNFETSLVWLGYVNSLCNPIIYTCMNRQFRDAFAKLLRISKKTPSAYYSSSSS